MKNILLTYFSVDGSYIETVTLKTEKKSKTAVIKEVTVLRNNGNLPGLGKKKNVHVVIELEDTLHLLQFKKRITVASAKGKGRRLQHWTAKKISELLNLPWGYDEVIAPREMGQSGTDIRLVADAKELFPWSIECKNSESWSVPAFIKQAKENQLPGTDWLVVMKKNQHEEIIVLDAEVFFDILRLMRGSKKGR
jgi:hypothetical protein